MENASDPVAKALWFIENQFAGDISLAEIAHVSGVSRFHLSRAFGLATGHSVMRYVRGRRLSEAARALAAGAQDILALALESGYGSHEAFTRAFCDQFGITPETVRARRAVDTLSLMEPIRMDKTLVVDLDPPRFVDGAALLVAGLGERYSFETVHGAPMLWQRFAPHIGHVPGQVGNVAYGVCCNSDGAGSFEYIAGVEVADFSELPGEFRRVRIPAQRYAVFRHADHIATIRSTVHTIWSKWLPDSGHQAADAPEFERYDEGFDPQTGSGGVEIWLPIKA
ncbi:MAG TPA: AraC family transcriptional regulator [Alphaproteobacteria bacterium]|nr:AraC family transcriptional regulator [Alphaproteobacteria bacterium]